MIRIEPWVGFLRLLQFSKSSWGIRLLEEWNYRGSKGKDGDGLEGFPSHQSDDIKSYLDIVDNIYLTYLYSYAVCVPCTFVVTSSWLPYFPSFVLLHESIFTSHLHPTRIHHDTWSIVILCDLAVQERHLFFLFFAISIHPTMLCFFMYLLLLELMQFANPWNFVQSATPATTMHVIYWSPVGGNTAPRFMFFVSGAVCGWCYMVEFLLESVGAHSVCVITLMYIKPVNDFKQIVYCWFIQITVKAFPGKLAQRHVWHLVNRVTTLVRAVLLAYDEVAQLKAGNKWTTGNQATLENKKTPGNLTKAG